MPGIGLGISVGLKSVIERFGPELHIDANAVSDPNGNEANAITGWVNNNLDVFESQNTEVNFGSYAFYGHCNTTPFSGARFRKTFTTEVGASYRITFYWRHVGSGGNWRFYPDYQADKSVVITNLETDWKKVEVTVIASGTNFVVQFAENSGTNNGGVYMDNFSFKKIL